ncbi:peptidase S8 and S53 [Histoplasma capsulatum]|uniref:Peptidase S8 and S53 n=1 Tax=Ajellomyces capsulatus TaxID=5037 RepID=A0A8A1M032_AJECA|nr:predicted protein [Histoplasma mississippiense (nom. inval.)]EDN02579.1 predicted protein [Histoplasma mississippiense (nom. inval.)]QSS58153.1 peptidase S8 and S53 [Histoplasma capsulatum]
MPSICINGNTLDPSTESRQLMDFGMIADDASKSDYVLIQASSDCLSTEEHGALQTLGVNIMEYVSEGTFLCSYKGTDLTQIRSLEFISWANTYCDQFVVQGSLKSRTPQVNQLSAFTATPKTSHLQLVDIIVHHDVDPNDDSVREAVAKAARADLKCLEATSQGFRLQVQQEYLDDIAAIDQVYLIQQVHPFVLWNNKAREIVGCSGTSTYTEPGDCQGEGQVVVACDTGFDIGDKEDTHPAFKGRVDKLYDMGRKGRSDDPDGHGTHVAGSVLGNGESKSMGGSIMGTAPKAHLVLQSVLDGSNGLGGIPRDLTQLFRVPYEECGARIHTNSWGSASPFGQLPYDASARQIDDFVWKHPDMVILFAGGNDGVDANRDGKIDQGQIGSQASAKNIITVGASENNRPDIPVTYGSRWPVDPLCNDRMADNPKGMAAFSSRGPTVEGRFKPDVVCPGTAVLSTLSRRAQMTSRFGQSSDPLWMFLAGTSMATPLAAGCVACVRECLAKNGVKSPTAALLKALILHGAMELVGQYTPSEAGPSPNNSSGWGLLNLTNSICIASGRGGGYLEGKALGHGEKAPTLTLTVPPNGTLKVTLVWTDPAGPHLQNDLDLSAIALDGQERHGNMGTGSGYDRVNNVEQIMWNNPPEGKVDITVKAFRITRPSSPQPYALVWSTTWPPDPKA